jgi:hypothetical protein
MYIYIYIYIHIQVIYKYIYTCIYTGYIFTSIIWSHSLHSNKLPPVASHPLSLALYDVYKYINKIYVYFVCITSACTYKYYIVDIYPYMSIYQDIYIHILIYITCFNQIGRGRIIGNPGVSLSCIKIPVK